MTAFSAVRGYPAEPCDQWFPALALDAGPGCRALGRDHRQGHAQADPALAMRIRPVRACPVDHGTWSRSQIPMEATSTVPRQNEVTFVERGGDSAVLPDLAECALDGVALLAGGGTWHLRHAWAPLTFTDQNPPARQDPVAPARRSATAQAKASYQHDQAGPTAASAACSPTWPPSRATRSASPARQRPCRCSPSPPASSGKRSSSSEPPSPLP